MQSINATPSIDGEWVVNDWMINLPMSGASIIQSITLCEYMEPPKVIFGWVGIRTGQLGFGRFGLTLINRLRLSFMLRLRKFSSWVRNVHIAKSCIIDPLITVIMVRDCIAHWLCEVVSQAGLVTNSWCRWERMVTSGEVIESRQNGHVRN